MPGAAAWQVSLGGPGAVLQVHRGSSTEKGVWYGEEKEAGFGFSFPDFQKRETRVWKPWCGS
ncbi:hypothetical protein GCM10008959_23720 [Deinococcus seoulensis]|uniref:Uncharacterized protein n=1 Tax=Deinococcus seoulensis TaxID=1837379 RepID=A0ABQ2RUL4_9DEIO|nr:hypothetical protein GCM10008959_23720 [Deinococcus seoulensis]